MSEQKKTNVKETPEQGKMNISVVDRVHKKKRLRYGGLSAALTVGVIALVIIVNYIFTGLASKNQWYADMSKEKLYGISDAADAFLSSTTDVPIRIIFLEPADQLTESEISNYVYQYALALDNKYDHISVEYIDCIKNPEQAKKYKTGDSSLLKTTDIVVSNEDDSKFFVYNVESFFAKTQTGSYFALNCERKFIVAMLQIRYGASRVCFTKGHDEAVQATELNTLLEDCAFEVDYVDLSVDDIPEDTRLIIINDPVYDFKGADDPVNEIDKLAEYMKYTEKGNLLVFISPDHAADLKNLNEYLEEWGFRVRPEVIVDEKNSVSADGRSLRAVYATAQQSGADLTKSLRTANNPPNTIVEYAAPIELVWGDSGQDNTQGEKYYRNCSSVLFASDSAMTYSYGKVTGSAANATIAALSSQQIIKDDNDKYYNYVMLISSKYFADTKYLETKKYGNRELLFETFRVFGKEQLPVDLNFKVFDDNSMDATINEAVRWNVVFTVMIPLAILAVGAVVYIRRRSK